MELLETLLYIHLSFLIVPEPLYHLYNHWQVNLDELEHKYFKFQT